jgi:hypothetical protein
MNWTIPFTFLLIAIAACTWHPDAQQGAIAVLMTPILQGGALALLLPVVWWVSRNART